MKKWLGSVLCLDFPTTLCVVSRVDYASTRGSTCVAMHNPGSLEAIGRKNVC